MNDDEDCLRLRTQWIPYEFRVPAGIYSVRLFVSGRSTQLSGHILQTGKSLHYKGWPFSTFDIIDNCSQALPCCRFAIKYLHGVKNSSSAQDFLRAHRRSNIHLYPDDRKALPIPDVPPAEQIPIVALVDSILAARRANPNADVSAMKRELDTRVATLYGN